MSIILVYLIALALIILWLFGTATLLYVVLGEIIYEDDFMNPFTKEGKERINKINEE